MFKKIIFLFVCLITKPLFAASAFLYQIDLIVFTHSQAEEIHATPFVPPPDLSNALALSQVSGEEEEIPYTLLPKKTSNLLNEYNKLNKVDNYKLLLHYTWLQPSENNKSIITNALNDDWNLNGTIRVKQNAYYSFDTELVLTNNKNMQFPVQYNKRLKPEIVYYLDHPYAGILIKIHQII